MTGGSSRKLRTGRTRLRPEIKYRDTQMLGLGVLNNTTNTATLPANSSRVIITFPDRGTTDQQRIGDTILGKKLYIRFTLNQIVAQATLACVVRIIIWNNKVDYDTTGDYPAFFQHSVQRQASNGIVNREKVNKVFYDRQFIMKPARASDIDFKKSVNYNISMKWPIVFDGSAASTTVKDPRNKIYLTVIGYQPVTAELAAVCFCDIITNFYYSDS